MISQKQIWFFFIVGAFALKSSNAIAEISTPGTFQQSHSALEEWWQGEGISGGWWGWRAKATEAGVLPFAEYTWDVLGNTRGGLKRSTVYSGLLNFGVELDLEKLLGWTGARFVNSWNWLSGRDASEDLVGNFLTASNIAGFNTLRVFDLWLEQKLGGELVSFKLGQFSADSEFLISDTAGLFLNGTFGWPGFAFLNLPEGGPAYPMSAPAIRLALQPAEWFTFQSAVFQGNVFAQDVNRHGFRYRLSADNGATWMMETQLRWQAIPSIGELPGSFKTGLWLQSGKGANPFASDDRTFNTGVYFILDQQIFTESSAPLPSPAPSAKNPKPTSKNPAQPAASADSSADEPLQGLAAFARFGVAPRERNFTPFYFDTGLVYTGLLPLRDQDQLGIALAYAQLSPRAKATLRDEGISPRAHELVLEATYRIQLNPWLALQPNLQAIFHPGADASLRDALLIGFRGQVSF